MRKSVLYSVRYDEFNALTVHCTRRTDDAEWSGRPVQDGGPTARQVAVDAASNVYGTRSRPRCPLDGDRSTAGQRKTWPRNECLLCHLITRGGDAWSKPELVFCQVVCFLRYIHNSIRSLPATGQTTIHQVDR